MSDVRDPWLKNVRNDEVSQKEMEAHSWNTVYGSFLPES